LVGTAPLRTASVTVEVDDEPLGMELLDPGANVWKGDYTLDGSGGTLTIEGCGAGLTGPSTCTAIDFSARYVVASQGGFVTSADERLGLRIGEGALRDDGYVLVIPTGRSPSGEPLALRRGKERVSLAGPRQSGLPGYRLSPEGLWESASARLEIRYEGLLLPEGTTPDQITIERADGQRFSTTVDPDRKVVSTTVNALGEYRLALGPPGSSTIVSPTYLQVTRGFPNPFRASTTFQYEIQTPQRVTIRIFDPSGRQVVQLLDAAVPAGKHAIDWDGRTGSGLVSASGLYFLRIETEHKSASQKVMRIR
jgi:hypothetical protein